MEILDLNGAAFLTNMAAGRACSPTLFSTVISLDTAMVVFLS